jgi:hypothetical protein
VTLADPEPGLIEMRRPVFLARASFQIEFVFYYFFGKRAYAKHICRFCANPLVGKAPRSSARRDGPQAPASMVGGAGPRVRSLCRRRGCRW